MVKSLRKQKISLYTHVVTLILYSQWNESVDCGKLFLHYEGGVQFQLIWKNFGSWFVFVSFYFI